MIGSVSDPQPVNAVRTLPDGITASGYFGYDQKYRMTDTLVPGRAYWIKVRQDGLLIIGTAHSTQQKKSSAKAPADKH